MKILYVIIGILLGLLIYPTRAVPQSLIPEAKAQEIIKPEPVIPDVLKRIAKCESNNIATAKNPYSSAKGIFQFLDGTWKHYGQKLWGEKLKDKDVFNPDHQWELALYVYKVNGTKDWEADPKSYNCWKST